MQLKTPMQYICISVMYALSKRPAVPCHKMIWLLTVPNAIDFQSPLPVQLPNAVAHQILLFYSNPKYWNSAPYDTRVSQKLRSTTQLAALSQTHTGRIIHCLFKIGGSQYGKVAGSNTATLMPDQTHHNAYIVI